jgi:hypothetical protein
MALPFEALSAYRWPSGEPFWLGTLQPRLSELAQRLGVPLQSWVEDGLGPAVGTAFRLPSGRVVFLEEYAHPIESGATTGPEAWADLAVVATEGCEVIRTEFLTALGLSDQSFSFRPPPEHDQVAKERLAEVQAWTSARNARGAPPSDHTRGAT